MPSQWNMFVKKIYEEGKSKDSNYQFSQALKDASKRKSEMGHSASASGTKKHKKSARRVRGKSRSASMAASMAGGKKLFGGKILLGGKRRTRRHSRRH